MPPPVPSISQRPTGSSLGTIRVGASDNNIWFGWRVGVPIRALRSLTFSEALAQVDLMSVANVELSSAQMVSPEVPKPLDYRLQAGERGAVNRRLRELNEQVMAYRVDNLPSESGSRRKVFELAKAINAPLIVVGAGVSNLTELDTLAGEFGINVAVESRNDPKDLMNAIGERSVRIGVAADVAAWTQAGIKAVDALSLVKSRLLLVKVTDRAAGLDDFFLAAYRAGVKPLSITIEPSGGTEGDLLKSLNTFERIMWPAMAERVRTMLGSPAGKIRGADLLAPDLRRRISEATPRQAIATPKKPRKLLVTDIQMYSGHSTIPHGNWLLELMGKQTGAFEPVFSNDLSLLTYPKIKEFDAIYLNNVCGMVYNDPDVREGILRFVREGGGIGGHHAVTFANNHWPEFAEMMGGWAGAHHVEKQMIKVDDPGEPAHQELRIGELRAHRRVLSISALLAVLARQAARAAEHRRREIGSRHREPLLRPMHASRSGLRSRVDQNPRQGSHLLHTARPHRRSSIRINGGLSTCWRRSNTFSATSRPTPHREAQKLRGIINEGPKASSRIGT